MRPECSGAGMREKYLELWREEVKRGRAWRWPLRLAGAALSPVCGRSLTGPISAEIMVTWRCNARCEMCDYPSRSAGSELSTGEIERIIDELAGLGVAGVSLCGGEPFLRPDLFEIVGHAKSRRLMVQLATNGLLLDERNSESLVESGVDMVTISIDSPRPEVFSAIRKVPGIYETVTAGVRRLAECRRRRGRGPGIIISTAVTHRNLNDITEILDLASVLGADAVTLIPVQEVATIPNRYTGEDRDRLLELLRRLAARKASGDRVLDNSAGYLKWLLARESGREPGVACLIPYTDLHIGPRGEVFPCIYYSGMNQPWGNIRQASLRELWYSRDYQQRRREARGCRKCSIPCHWEMNLLFHRMLIPRLLSR